METVRQHFNTPLFQREFPLQEGLQRCQDERDPTVDDDAFTRATCTARTLGQRSGL